jgi:ABC-2 type transport system permease protein
LISVLLALPVVAAVAAGAFLDPVWYLAALAAGLVIGVAALVGGVSWGGSIVDRKAPELLAFTLQN